MISALAIFPIDPFKVLKFIIDLSLYISKGPDVLLICSDEVDMRFVCGKVIVTDIHRSTAFYEDVLMQDVVVRKDHYVVLSSGIMLFDLTVWKEYILIAETDVRFSNNDVVLSFEENDFDDFLSHLKSFSDIELVHDTIKKPNGLRIIRFYDPDHHVIEVNETKNINPDDILKSEMAFLDLRTCATTEVLSSCCLTGDIDSVSENKLNKK